MRGSVVVESNSPGPIALMRELRNWREGTETAEDLDMYFVADSSGSAEAVSVAAEVAVAAIAVAAVAPIEG